MIGANYKLAFFDSAKVIRAVDVATRKVLSKFGAFVRTRARSIIRPGKGISRPGSPPKSHTGTLRKLIYFGYDASRRSVAIGPVQFEGRSEGAAALEYGGPSNITSYSGGKKVTRRVQIAARPFMSPALEKELPKLPAMWSGSVKK